MDKVILFVDDEPSILSVLSALFRTRGYVPRCTMDGNEALDIVKREHIRVCFLDLRMPKMDGVELCRRIKQIDPGACVYALSAFVDDGNPIPFNQAGFDGCFLKPFKIDDLLGAGQKAFERLEQKDAALAKA